MYSSFISVSGSGCVQDIRVDSRGSQGADLFIQKTVT
jgi:hypothetical protein